MTAGVPALVALAALLPRAGQAADPGAGDATPAERAAAEAATWVGTIAPEETLAVSLSDPDWWVFDVCRGATVVVDLLPVGDGIVEAVLLDADLVPLARTRSAGGDGRIHWLGTRSGRVYLKVGPAPDTGAPRSPYRLRAWWVDAMTCPGRAEGPAASGVLFPPPAEPAPGSPATTTAPASQALRFASATPAEPSPPRSARRAGTTWSTPAGLDASDGPRSRELPPGVHEHDGFLWRLALGLGYVGWEERHWDYHDSIDSDWVNTGGGGLNMAFGGSWNERYYLYFDLNLNFPQLLGFGVGFGAYLGDEWFVDAAVGYHLCDNGYLAAAVGKEWWVGEQWLTGLSVRWMGGTGWVGETDWTTSVTVNWSLTYN
ncbi:MAG: hypothetical protein JXB32_13135 [Deltaproteobacteria bacterium]|nr:hypothetical protein [Deltaproteobacteria bacterium]